MLTQNFINLLLTNIVASEDSPGSRNTVKGMLPVYSMYDGSVLGYFARRYSNSAASFSSYSLCLNNSSYGIILGTGTAAPSRSDFKLGSMITSGISSSGTSRTQGVDSSGNIYVEYQITVKNTSSNAITISEIGYQQYTHYNYINTAQNGENSHSSAQVTGPYWLAERSLLSSPLTLEPGETGIIDYRITIDIS